MGSTYHNLRFHWVCSTKERRPFIQETWMPQFHEYLGGTIRGLEGVPLSIGGVADHVHALIGLKPVHCLSDFVRELKKATSVWASQHHEACFEWQEGYSVFSVSYSQCERVERYIARQGEHHRRRGFLEELTDLLRKHAVEFDPKYFV
jgi:putative transposase